MKIHESIQTQASVFLSSNLPSTTDPEAFLSKMALKRAPRVLFLSIPLHGHLRPLVLQARALERRGWSVCVASLEEARGSVEPLVPFRSLGEGPEHLRTTADVFAEATAERNFARGSRSIVRWVHDRWGILFDGALEFGRQWRPDLVVTDVITTCGVDVADALGVPVVLNNPDVLPMVSEAVLPADASVPLMFSGRGRTPRTLVDRALHGPLRRFGLMLARRAFHRELDPVREARGLPRVDPIARAADRCVLVNTMFGLEYERPLPPRITLVGPMLDDDEPMLDPDLEAWLSAGDPVVYANLGTLAAPSADLVKVLARGFEAAPARVLWVLRGKAAEIAHETAPGLRIEPWISSPIAVLRHPSVKAFISHCGVNSVHEAVSCGVPIIGVPLFAAQHDMAMRARDAGIAHILSKDALGPDAVAAAVRRVVEDEDFRRPMPFLRSAIAAAGGVERAADLMEAAVLDHKLRQR